MLGLDPGPCTCQMSILPHSQLFLFVLEVPRIMAQVFIETQKQKPENPATNLKNLVSHRYDR
jgi:hypothetical protein